MKIAREDNHCRVELFQVNRLNTLFSELVKEQLIELVEEPGNTVQFNLQDIRFIDSAGFDVLREVAQRAGEAGSRFQLCNVSEDVRELLVLTELEACFELVNCVHTREKILMVLD